MVEVGLSSWDAAAPTVLVEEAGGRVSDFDAKTLGTRAQEIPNRAAARALEVASIGQQRYEALAVRGKTLVDSIRTQASTRQLFDQAGNTVSRGKAAVTTARKAADDTYAAILSTFGVGRTEAEEVVTETRATVNTATKTAAKKTTTAAKKTTGTAKKGAASTRSAAKGAGTSAKKTASTASKAASDARGKVGN